MYLLCRQRTVAGSQHDPDLDGPGAGARVEGVLNALADQRLRWALNGVRSEKFPLDGVPYFLALSLLPEEPHTFTVDCFPAGRSGAEPGLLHLLVIILMW